MCIKYQAVVVGSVHSSSLSEQQKELAPGSTDTLYLHTHTQLSLLYKSNPRFI